MVKARNFRKLFPLARKSPIFGKYPLIIVPLVALAACKADNAQREEIRIEAIPVDSSLFAFHSARDKKEGPLQHPIQLHFDHSAQATTPTSSFLYRGEYLSYMRDQGHLRAGSVLVEKRTAPWQGPLLVLPPIEGRSYIASVWVKLVETDHPATVRLVLTRVSEGTVTNLLLKEIQADPRTWQHVEGEFIGNKQADSDINTLSLEVDKPDVDYLIDDFIVAYAELSVELQAAARAAKDRESAFISNGSVEEGLEPWSHQGGVISRSTAYAHTGKHSLLIAGRKQEWNAPMMPVEGLKDDKSYRFSIFVRLSDGLKPANVKLTLKRTTSGQTSFVSVGGGQATSTAWTEISGTFSASNVSDSERISTYLECEDPLASYFVDSLTIEELSSE